MRRRLSPSLVLALAAVVLASAGSATAGSLITGAQIKNGSVTSADIRDGSIALRDIRESAREALRGDVGPQGAAGARGERGAQGPAGHGGVTGVGIVPADTTIAPGETGTATVACPEGHAIVAGGYHAESTAVVVSASRADMFAPAQWRVTATNNDPDPVVLTVYALCAG